MSRVELAHDEHDEPEVREIEALTARFRRMRPDLQLLVVTAFAQELFGTQVKLRAEEVLALLFCGRVTH